MVCMKMTRMKMTRMVCDNIPVIVLSSGDPERVSSVYKETRKFNIFPKVISCSSKEVYESERDFANTVTMAHRKSWEYIVEKSIKRAIILEVVDEWYKYEEQCDIDSYHIRPIVAMGKQTK